MVGGAARLRAATPTRSGLRWQLGSRAADVAQIVPELAERLGDVGEPPDMETEQARFRVFDSFAGFLAGASSARPLVLVLDDLHWADEPSLRLLRFVARRLADTGLLLVGAYRDVELGRHHPLAETLGDLAGFEGTRGIALRGLDPNGIAEYIERTAGVDRPPPDLAAAIRDQTGGNPFFIGEVVRLMAAEGTLGEAEGRRQVAIPQGVREVVGRRLDRLSEAANEVLRIAAVIGREFRLEVVERVCDRSDEEIEAALREAVDNRLVEESAEVPGRYAFSHALVRETLQAEVPAAKRVRMHRAIGKALEEVYAGDLDRHAAELAHHFLEAAPLGEVERAVEYATLAAKRASERLAYEDAAAIYARALDALELDPEPSRERRLELLLELGAAQTKAARVADARQTLERAANLARELDRPEELAHAALGICLLSTAGIVDEPLIDLLEEALERIGDDDSALRSHLLSGLAQELYWIDPAGRSNDLGLEALEMARRVGDPGALAAALVRRQFTGIVDPDQARRRLEESGELHDLAKRWTIRSSSCARTCTGSASGSSSARSAVSTPTSPRSTGSRTSSASRSGCGTSRCCARCGRSSTAASTTPRNCPGRPSRPATGRRSRSRRSSTRPRSRSCVACGARPRTTPSSGASITQLAELAEQFPAIPAWRSSLAASHAELGHDSEARAVFESLAAQDFDDVPLDAQWAISLTLLAEVAASLGDAPRARALYELLSPYDGLIVIAGRAAASYGPVSRVLGVAGGDRRAP